MDDVKHFRKLGRGKCNWLVAPNVQAMMTGAKYANQMRNGIITLIYEDNSQESRLSKLDLCTEFDGFLSVVAFVQAGRAAEVAA